MSWFQQPGIFLIFALTLVQEPPSTLTSIHFDVVSIKENRSAAEQGGVDIPSTGDRITVTNARMFRIIAFAYNRSRSDLIVGLPNWTREERWDIVAKIADEDIPAFSRLSFEQKKAMLQIVLKERCQLQAHTGKQNVPVYQLLIAKGGLKIHEASSVDKEAAATSPWNIQARRGEIEGRAVPIAALMYALSNINLDRQIVDKTGLTALYDFDLKWTPDDTSPDSLSGLSDTQAPAFFTALKEELGLRLEPAKADVDAVFIEHIERPSGN